MLDLLRELRAPHRLWEHVPVAILNGYHFTSCIASSHRTCGLLSLRLLMALRRAAAEKAITVGASTLGDQRAYFSNHGPCVDVFALA
ncbi:hypothetical protein NUW54_g10158 [Trametes sanguinea]|uniref:Uncharacterized protein n=1 Tax=Trametes sanguinea TaxID=158606 RepID=A0ACC1P2E1_9APHY|nr:hypothetical protein NUW54_g10158 [Trametes sanguinea]